MNLHEGVKLQGRPAVIEDCLRNELPGFLVDIGCKVGAEIGVYKAEFTELFCKAGLKMYGVDPWKAFSGQGRSQKVQDRQDFLFGHASRTVAPYDCTLIRKTSMDALADFPDGSLDFVYIDGNHEFPWVAEDIYHWSKKVKKGGVISGHDYFNTTPTAENVLCHVRVVVDAYAALYGIENWWLFGKRRIRPGSRMWSEEKKDDRYYSWMWFKK